MPQTTSPVRTPRSSTANAPGLRLIFRAFDRAMQRRRAARDDSLHQLRRRAKGRRNLARIEHAEPPARSGADVEQPPARAQRFAASDRPPRQARPARRQRLCHARLLR